MELFLNRLFNDNKCKINNSIMFDYCIGGTFLVRHNCVKDLSTMFDSGPSLRCKKIETFYQHFFFKDFVRPKECGAISLQLPDFGNT